ncbi:Crp/Fnr family transcriptional regulator [Nibrella saemangeumensis]|uniref:Crp/Fnr family transcriptional regulator n=1 Tax=Nibrella saemangeumensis TaxID=1084526 RepID=A0ABP8MZ42_9BACT
MNTLLTLIEAIYPVSTALKQSLVSLLSHASLPKGSLLLSPDQISTKIYFVEKGLVRGYYLKDGKDITTGFMPETSFVISPVSFYRQQPSFEYLETLEESPLWSLSYQHLSHLYSQYPEFNYVGRVVTEQYYTRSELRAHHLRMQTADERYRAFLSEYPTLANRVPNKHIASFLGLTPETFSRIRAKRD